MTGYYLRFTAEDFGATVDYDTLEHIPDFSDVNRHKRCP